MKTVPVRIRADQVQQLQECFGSIASRDKLVQRGVDLLLEIEGPVYAAAQKEAGKAKIKRKK